MTVELVRGQNHPLPDARLEVRVTAGQPVIAGATLGDRGGKIAEEAWVAHPGSPTMPGLEVSRQAAANHHLAIDLGALPEAVHHVNILLALPVVDGRPGHFGAVAAPFVAVTTLDGADVATFTMTGLDTESAVVAVELYRRQGAWKVRAVGQGYAGGLADMLRDQGLPAAGALAASINEAVAQGLARSVAPPPQPPGGERVRRAARVGASDTGRAPNAAPQPAPQPPPPPEPAAGEPSPPAAAGRLSYQHPNRPRTAQPASPEPMPAQSDPSQPVAGDATGWTMEERLYNQVWGMFEDLARTVAAYRSAVDFADSRMARELDQLLASPSARIGAGAEAARAAAQAKRDQLVDQARTTLDNDLNQLLAEAAVVEPALPPPLAAWDSLVWDAFQATMDTPMAVRLGDLCLPENFQLCIPMLVRLPLERGLWIDSGRPDSSPLPLDGDDVRQGAMQVAVALAVRLLAAYPAGEFTVHVIDPAGSASNLLAPLVRSGTLPLPPATGVAGVSAVLAHLTQRVDLVQMAMRGGATDSLPPHLDLADQLLIINDFPYGFDDRAVNQLRYLADEGPSVGVQLLMVADREDAAAYGPILDPLWRSLLRLTPTPDQHLADPWVGHAWTYQPLLPPPGSDVLFRVANAVAMARRTREG